MFEDSERIRDTVKIKELPEGERKIHQTMAMQLLTIFLLDHLRDNVLAYLDEVSVTRDSDPSKMSHPTSQSYSSMIPTPRQLKEMIESTDAWGRPKHLDQLSEISNSLIMNGEIRDKALELARLVVGADNLIL